MRFVNDFDYYWACVYAVKFLLRIDDALDLFAEHAVGGIIGLLINALFARADVIALDGVNTSVRISVVIQTSFLELIRAE